MATISCKRDIVRDGAVATIVPHPLMGDGYCLRTVDPRYAERRCAELARRLRTRCLRGVVSKTPRPAQLSEAHAEAHPSLRLYVPSPTFSVWSKILNPLISATVPHYRMEGKILVKQEEFDGRLWGSHVVNITKLPR